MSVLVIGQNYWGHADDLKTAKSIFRKEGGDLAKGYTIVEFPSGLTFQGVDPIWGEVTWKIEPGHEGAPEPAHREVKARS